MARAAAAIMAAATTTTTSVVDPSSNLVKVQVLFYINILIIFIIDAVNPAGGENKRRDRRHR